MVRGFLFFCFCLVIGASLYQLAANDAGYFLIVWGKKSIEMSLWFFMLSLLLITFFAWLIWSFFSGSLRGIVAAKRKVFGYSDAKAQAKTVEGLIDYIEENWALARKKLTRSASKVPTPIINYLAAARSAYELGDEQAALELLHKAEKSDSHGGLAVSITQARMQLANKQYEQALATLERASTIKPEHPVVLALRQQVYTALKDWNALKKLLPQLNKHNIGNNMERHHLEKHLYSEQLNEKIEKYQDSNDDEKLSQLNKVWGEIPNHLQCEESILSSYASQLMALGQHNSAEKLLAASLNKQWQGQWLDLYGLLLCEDPKLPLQTAEKWLSDHGDSPHLLLALGRLCLQNQQWGRAIDYFEKSIQLYPRVEAYAELARVLDYIGETEKSLHFYKRGLINSSSILINNDVYRKS